MITENLNQVADALALLLQQFRGRAGVEALLASYAKQQQELESAIVATNVERRFAVAVGDQLDALGTIIGLKRNGLGDDDYRDYLAIQILVNKSGGTIEDVLQVYALLGLFYGFGDGDVVISQDQEEVAEFYLEIIPAITNGENLVRFLKAMKAGGVRALQAWPNLATTQTSEAFSFGPSNDVAGYGAGNGFGDGKFIVASDDGTYSQAQLDFWEDLGTEYVESFETSEGWD